MMNSVLPGGFGGDWKELNNKIDAFRLFQFADREARVSDHGDIFRSIWVLEGTGHIAGLESSLTVKGLLSDAKASRLPDAAMIPLHAGMGTAFAEKLFRELPSNPSEVKIVKTVGRFIDACSANCRPGWEDACIEPFGLVVRCLYPQLLTRVSAAADALDSRWRALFWHGVGRGLYFTPANFLPASGAHERMLKNAAAESNVASDRHNVLAGLIWAVMLVNLRHPAAIQSVAAICQRQGWHEEFTNGLISALMAWRHMAPEDRCETAPYISAKPQWKEWIEVPVRDAFENIFPGLNRLNNIPSLYTYRTREQLLRLSAMMDETIV